MLLQAGAHSFQAAPWKQQDLGRGGNRTKPEAWQPREKTEWPCPSQYFLKSPFYLRSLVVSSDSHTLGARRARNTHPHVRGVIDTAYKALGLESSMLTPLMLLTAAATIAKANTQGFLVARHCPWHFIHGSSFNSHNPCESIWKAEAGGSLGSLVSTT